jgi:hypothetical protein
VKFRETVANVRCVFTILKSGPPEIRWRRFGIEDSYVRRAAGWETPDGFARPHPEFQIVMDRLFNQVRPNVLDRLASL